MMRLRDLLEHLVKPYPGARCMINDNVVIVDIFWKRSDHPMCFGLILSVSSVESCC